jgi:DNA-binding CsgD family transcriptional regulator
MMPPLSDNLEEAVQRLTPREKECLRLVAQLMTSKQIALQLGISKHTVDERIERACRRIGAPGRYEAARILASHESGSAPPIESGPHSVGLVPTALSQAPDPQPSDDSMARRDAAEGRPSSDPRALEGGLQRLSLVARLGLIGLMAVVSALAFGAILAGLEALRHLH